MQLGQVLLHQEGLVARVGQALDRVRHRREAPGAGGERRARRRQGRLDRGGPGVTTRQAGGIALVLIVVAVFMAMVFRTIELSQERGSLSHLRELQESPVREAAKLRRQVEALAAGVAQLAAAGDGGAKQVVEEMRREGIVLPALKH